MAVGSLLGLIALGLAWELWLAPTGNRSLALKVLPLAWPLVGLLRHRMYTYRWVSLLVWIYFTEGVIRAASDRGTSAWLAGIEVVLCLTLFAACAVHVRWRLANRSRSDTGVRLMNRPLLEQLRHAVGAAHVLTEGDLSAWEVDWRKRHHGKALAVVRPASTSEVASVVRLCAEHRVSIVAQGGNTGLVGGSTPDESGQQILLSLARLKRVRAIDAANLTMTVDAGCILQNVQQAAADAGLLFPLSLAAEGSCTIGGNLATNAGGTQVLRFGSARDLCLGLEVVTADGEVWDGLSGLRKDNTGYDLRHLYVGSEGTLGIITAATLKLFPQPAATVTAWVAVESVEAAVHLLQHAQQRLASGLTGFELMNGFALDLVRTHFPDLRHPLPSAPWTVLLEQSDSEGVEHARTLFEQLLENMLEEGIVSDAALAESIDQSRAMWHLRESIPLAQAEEGPNIKHDISVAVSRIPAFVAATDAALQDAFPGVRMVDFGHLGDGNLHYNVQAPQGVDVRSFMTDHEKAINALVYRSVAEHGGSISAEHGIGTLKRDALQQYKPRGGAVADAKHQAGTRPTRPAQPGPPALRPGCAGSPDCRSRYCSGPFSAGGNGKAMTSMPSSRSASASSLVARPRMARSVTSP